MGILHSGTIENFLLEIPSVNYSKMVNLDGTLDEGIAVHKLSFDENKPLVLVGHSGNGLNAVFNELLNVNVNDLIYLKYPYMKRTYYVTKRVMFKKGSTLSLNSKEDYLYLITCDLNNQEYQWVLEAKLVKNS